jgi:hypothetical protein
MSASKVIETDQVPLAPGAARPVANDWATAEVVPMIQHVVVQHTGSPTNNCKGFGGSEESAGGSPIAV